MRAIIDFSLLRATRGDDSNVVLCAYMEAAHGSIRVHRGQGLRGDEYRPRAWCLLVHHDRRQRRGRHFGVE
jgi:hypothetical protein